MVHKKPKRDSTPYGTQQKITVLSDLHANGVVNPYQFNNETGKGVNYFQDWTPLFGQSVNESPRLFSCRTEPSSHYTHHPFSFCTNCTKGIGRYCSKGWPERSLYLTELEFSLWVFVKDQADWTSVRNLTKLKRRVKTAI